MENSNSNVISYDNAVLVNNQDSILDDGRSNYEPTTSITQKSKTARVNITGKNIYDTKEYSDWLGYNLKSLAPKVAKKKFDKKKGENIKDAIDYVILNYTSNCLDTTIKLDDGILLYNVPQDLSEYRISSIAIDAEWFENEFKIINEKKFSTNFLISKQATLNTNKGKIHVVLIDDTFPSPNDKVFHFINDPIVYVHSNIQEITIMDIIEKLKLKFFGQTNKLKDITIPLYIFYSPYDFRCMLSSKELRELYAEGIFSKKRNINGKFKAKKCLNKFKDDEKTIYDYVNFKVRDLIGAFNSSLDKSFDLVGMFNLTKDLVDVKRKGEMDKVARENMDLFLLYLLGDTMYLQELWLKRVEQINNLVEIALGINPEFTEDNCPRTSGALVSKVMMIWMEHEHPLATACAEIFAKPVKKREWCFKHFLKQLPMQKSNILEGYMYLYKKRGKKAKMEKVLLRDLHKLWNHITFKEGEIDESFDGVAGMARASIGAFGGLTNNETALNVVVFGGRCNNENPTLWKIIDVFDIDLSSCYGTSLRSLDFNIGRPTIINGNGICLKDFKTKYIDKTYSKGSRHGKPNKERFADGEAMYQLILSSEQNEDGTYKLFDDLEQDILFSKIGIDYEDIIKTVAKKFKVDNSGAEEIINDTILGVEKAHVGGTLRLLRKMFYNTVATKHDIIPMLEKLATNKEKSELNNVEVVTASGYLAKNEIHDEEVFYKECCKIAKNQNFHKTMDFDQTYTLDNRPEIFFRIPLEDFIGKFIDKRSELKSKSKQLFNDNNYDEGNKYNIQQNAYKLFINTLYGCLASPYFPISNAILANNITAKARFGVWMINKALNTLMSITDGGAYSNNMVRRFVANHLNNNGGIKLPGLTELANPKLLDNHRNIEITKLVDDFEEFCKDCENDLKGKHKELDSVATNWVNDFFYHYDLKLQFNVEHKEDNTAKEMVVFNKSDYLFIDPLKPSFNAVVGENGLHSITSIKDPFYPTLNEGEKTISYSVKVRGAKENDHPKKKLLFFLGGYIPMKPQDIVMEVSNQIGFGDYFQALGSKTGTGEWAKHCLPGDTVYGDRTLKPNLNHLPILDVVQYEGRERNITNQNIEFKKRIESHPELLFNELLIASTDNEGWLQSHTFERLLQADENFISETLQPFGNNILKSLNKMYNLQ